MPAPHSLFASHPRLWRGFHYVYPVLSRRSKGLSVGVNLNPDKVCNWDCVYCQVDRSTPPLRRDVDLDQLRSELDAMLGWACGGRVWEEDPFRDAPEPMRRVNDIAFSGDGEPTTCPVFERAVALAVELKAAHGLGEVKIIVLSNMTVAHREPVRRALAMLDAHRGEIWAKLEAGTEAFYRRVDRSSVPFSRVLENIRAAGAVRPIVIQSMFMRLDGRGVAPEEFDAYLDRLRELAAGGCWIKLVQLYTIARKTADPGAAPLTDAELDALSARLRAALPELRCEVYYGVGE